MTDNNQRHSDKLNPRNVPPDFRLEMIKQKISFYKLTFLMFFTMVVGLISWLASSNWNELNVKASPFWQQSSMDPYPVTSSFIFLSLVMMILALSSIQECIGELGDPTLKKMGKSAWLALPMAVGATFLCLHFEIFGGEGSVQRLVKVVLVGTMSYTIGVVAFIVPYKSVLARLRRLLQYRN